MLPGSDGIEAGRGGPDVAAEPGSARRALKHAHSHELQWTKLE